MNSACRGFLVVIILAPLGLWGCSQDRSGGINKIKDLAARNAKLEEDYRVASSTAEALRKKLTQTETLRAELAQQVEQLQEVVKERDDLRKNLSSRTTERDALHNQMVQFGKELQSLAGRLEAATSPTRPTPTAANTARAH